VICTTCGCNDLLHAAVVKALEDANKAMDFVLNDSPEPGEDAQLTVEGYNLLCAATKKAVNALL